jgi:hypothetical protein
MSIRFERNRTSTFIIMYSLYLYFLDGLRLRNTSKSIQSSVQKTNNKHKIGEALSCSQPILIYRKHEIEMQDLYNRNEKLTHWIHKAKTETNLIEHMC